MAEPTKPDLSTATNAPVDPANETRVLLTAKKAFEQKNGRKFEKYSRDDQKQIKLLIDATRKVSVDGRADVNKVISTANSAIPAGGSLLDALSKAVSGDGFIDLDGLDEEPDNSPDNSQDEPLEDEPKDPNSGLDTEPQKSDQQKTGISDKEKEPSLEENPDEDSKLPKDKESPAIPKSKLPNLGNQDGLKFGENGGTTPSKPNPLPANKLGDNSLNKASSAGLPGASGAGSATNLPAGSKVGGAGLKQATGVDMKALGEAGKALAEGDAGKALKVGAQSTASAAATSAMDGLILSGIGCLVIIGLAPLFAIVYLIARMLGVKLPIWQVVVIGIANVIFFVITLILLLTVFEFYCNPTGYGLLDSAINQVQDFATDSSFCADYNSFRNSQFGGSFGNDNPQLSSYSGPISVGQWKDTINKYSQQYSLDSCIMYTVLAKESRGSPNAIGHDNHSADDPLQPGNPPTYGLNMPPRSNRSHGIGLTQITIFPEYSTQGGANWPAWPKVNGVSIPARWAYTIPEPGAPRAKYYTIAELLDPDTSIRLAAAKMSYAMRQSVNDVRSAFKNYNGGESYADDAMRIYKDCKAGNINTK